MLHLGIDYPRTLAFNDPEIALENWEAGWPALLKPEQGGSGARMYLLNSADEFPQLFRERPDLCSRKAPLLQEYFPGDPARGIVRMEFLGGELLYGMRVVSHGAFNICPAETCNPEDRGAGHCEIAPSAPLMPVEFYPYRRSRRKPSSQANGWSRRAVSTWQVSSISKWMAGASSTMSTRTRISANRLAKPLDSTRLTALQNGCSHRLHDRFSPWADPHGTAVGYAEWIRNDKRARLLKKGA